MGGGSALRVQCFVFRVPGLGVLGFVTPPSSWDDWDGLRTSRAIALLRMPDCPGGRPLRPRAKNCVKAAKAL